jgi:cold shock protein
MPTGTVAFWRDTKGYGRVVGDDGEEFFVHFSGVQREHQPLAAGQRVSFTISDYVAADDDEDFDDEAVRRCADDVRPL